MLLIHLLKCSYHAQRKSSSWIGTIGEQRRQIDMLLEQSPSLRIELPRHMHSSYSAARQTAAQETGLPLHTFAEANPFSGEQIFSLT